MVGKGHGLRLEPKPCGVTEAPVPSVRTAEIPTEGLGHDLNPVMCVPWPHWMVSCISYMT